ncbi:MAG: CoA transferase [Acidobacteriota bacterium]|nr:CoA transferase [Acidobacteriota bacterium]
MRQLLSDVSVLELAGGVTAGYCGKVFAGLGADVVKVEPPGGDPLRTRPGAFAHLGLNKRSLVVDPGREEGRARVRRLTRGVDLVVTAEGEGTLEDWGLDWDDLHRSDPGLVVVHISGFGRRGPYAGYAWTDLVAQTFAGTLVNAGPTHAPVKLPADAQLCAVGHTAALGALGAILRARACGEGALVECAAYEAIGGAPHGALKHLGFEYRGRTMPPRAASVAAGTGTLLPLGIFPCADGYVSMMTIPPQVPRLLDVIDDEALRAAFDRPDAYVHPETKEVLDAAMYPWLLSRTRAEVMAAAQAAGWPVTSVNRPEEVLEADHLHQRGFWCAVQDPVVGPVLVPGPLSRHSEGGWQLQRAAPTLGADDPAGEPPPVRRRPRGGCVARGEAGGTDHPPLRGVRVLDLTTVWSGPFVTLLLADLGAEVIRLESPWVFPPSAKGFEPRPRTKMILGGIMDTYGPPVEGHPDRPYNRHAMNNSVARGKLSCSLDPRTPRARELFLRLVEKSDVVIENLKLPTIHQMGIFESELMHRNPGLLMVRLPPAGLAGDWAGCTGFGAQFDALSGLSALVGPYGSEIAETPSTFHMDTVTGPAGAFAVLAALHYRAVSGRGQLVEVSQTENLLHQLGDVFVDSQLGIPAERLGNRDRRYAPQGLYPCPDQRWVALSVRDDREWAELARLVGGPPLAADGRFATAASRHAHHDELDRLIAAWTSERDCYDVFHTLQSAGVPAAPWLDESMLVDDPHVKARGWLRPLASRDVGTHDHLGPVFHGYPLAWDRGAPVLGEHNEYVFKEILGLGDDEYRQLVADRVAVEDYLDPGGNPL